MVLHIQVSSSSTAETVFRHFNYAFVIFMDLDAGVDWRHHELLHLPKKSQLIYFSASATCPNPYDAAAATF